MDDGTAADSPRLARVARPADIPRSLAELGVPRPRPVLVLVGGAGGMEEHERKALDLLLRTVVVPLVGEHGAAVVDGGTDAGVMRAIGRVSGGAVPLVGVVAEGTVRVPGGVPTVDDPAALEPHHAHVLLVPGRDWGDESPWLADVADVIAGAGPSLTLVVNGGRITYDDVTRSVARARPVVVVSGTGRTADEIAAARSGRVAGPLATAAASSTLVTVVAADAPDVLRATIGTLLSGS